MATAKKETVVTSGIDYTSEMSVWAKLLAVRAEFHAIGATKTGKNPHAEFMYFELEDIVPTAMSLFVKYGLLLIQTFVEGNAVARVMNVENPEQFIDFVIPQVLISEPGKFRMNEVQGIGAAVTYYRRYLYMIVLDLVEKDKFDDKNNSKTPTIDEVPTTAKKAKPISTEERKAIKQELTSEDRNINEEEVEALKSLMKKLLSIDPDQEEKLNEIAIRTDGLTKCTKSQFDALVVNLNEMIAVYEGA